MVGLYEVTLPGMPGAVRGASIVVMQNVRRNPGWVGLIFIREAECSPPIRARAHPRSRLFRASAISRSGTSGRAGEVEGQVEEVVTEGVVLLGVEHLEQRRRRVAVERVAPELSTTSWSSFSRKSPTSNKAYMELVTPK